MAIEIEKIVLKTYELVKELNQKMDYLIETRREYYLRRGEEYESRE